MSEKERTGTGMFKVLKRDGEIADFNLNKIKDAIETYNKLIAEYHFSDKIAKSQLRLGELYIKTEDYAKAENVLRDFIRSN